MQQFVSDNNAGMCPQALAALVKANGEGHAVGYGDDRWTAAARDKIRALFETDCDVHFVFSGTGANALALAHICRSYHAVIAHRTSHIAEDETGAPEFYTGGAKVLLADDPTGKVRPAAIEAHCAIIARIHASRPRVVTLTQSTELGTVYRAEEIAAATDCAKRFGLKVHMDGARFANAVAALDCKPADITWRAGVDVLSFGGTKNGLAAGEAVVFFDRALSDEFSWRIKQSGQLNSKMRLVSAPWLGLLDDNVWLRNARHANAMARRLGDRLAAIPGLRLMQSVEANAVFVEMAPALQAAIRARGWQFYTFLGDTGCRLMCAWDTAPETVDRFAADLAQAAADCGDAGGN
jgi:threonine aldolase